MAFTMFSYGQIVGLLGFALVFSTWAIAVFFPQTIGLPLTLLFFLGMFFVVCCACANVEVQALAQ